MEGVWKVLRAFEIFFFFPTSPDQGKAVGESKRTIQSLLAGGVVVVVVVIHFT